MRARAVLLLFAATVPSSSCEERAASFHPDRTTGGVWICPMCPEVARAAAGPCPRCGMALLSVKTRQVLTCPHHPPTLSTGAASSERCAICGRTLVPVTMASAWRCREHPSGIHAAGGTCPRCGAPLEERFEPIPHGDHHPRHGGILFMAPDQWHHLEGVWSSPDEFRLYFYDDFTRPLPAAGFRARILMGDEGAARPVDLAPAGGGAFLEARIASSPPLVITALVTFSGKEERFDFVFPSLSREGGAAGAQEGASAAAPTQGPPAGPSAPAPAIPGSLEEIAAAVLVRDARLRELITRGTWDQVYVPALEAKDLALALEERAAGWEEARRRELERAVRALVRGAWLLDLAGDRGDGEKVREEYRLFAEGVAGLRRLFEAPGR